MKLNDSSNDLVSFVDFGFSFKSDDPSSSSSSLSLIGSRSLNLFHSYKHTFCSFICHSVSEFLFSHSLLSRFLFSFAVSSPQKGNCCFSLSFIVRERQTSRTSYSSVCFCLSLMPSHASSSIGRHR